MATGMRIGIDTERCIGAAMCVLHAPAVFTQNDDGVAELLPEDTGGAGDADHADHGNDPAVREAVATCPVQAITLR
ncbi:ferredoxin [Streptomyces sp. NPDC050509]|uniref:ferredoxin n=1 Tax=Streptomyces sp. NPDC050509 TaxID=3365620 RepID=UPI003799BE72